MKKSKLPRKLKKAVNCMRATEYRTFPYWGRRSRRRTKWVVRGELEFKKVFCEIKRKEALIKELEAAQKLVDGLMIRPAGDAAGTEASQVATLDGSDTGALHVAAFIW